MDAKDNPVISSGKEVNSADFKTGQRKARRLDVLEDDEPMIALADGLADSEEGYQAELAFLEEAVKIRVMVPVMAGDKHPPRTVRCWANGKGAEQFTNGKWMQCGWLPLNADVITRRKYVEILLRAKGETVTTEVVQHQDREENIARRVANGKYSISILGDNSPRAHEWISTLVQEQ